MNKTLEISHVDAPSQIELKQGSDLNIILCGKSDKNAFVLYFNRPIPKEMISFNAQLLIFDDQTKKLDDFGMSILRVDIEDVDTWQPKFRFKIDLEFPYKINTQYIHINFSLKPLKMMDISPDSRCKKRLKVVYAEEVSAKQQHVQPRKASIGQVKVVQRDNKKEPPKVDTSKFTDFRLGRICHLEGNGEIADKYNDTYWNVKLTVYPFNVYDIMLSDFVQAGIITPDDAAVVGPVSASRIQLEANFNKLKQPISNNKVLLDAFCQKDSKIGVYKLRDTDKIRKLLSMAKKRESVFSEYKMSRDAWQPDSKRQREGRYNYSKECPPGEYFINYKSGGKYRVMVSQYASAKYMANQLDAISCIDDYPGEGGHPHPPRGSIALHKGGAQVSIGCITFNLKYVRDKNNFNEFTEIMYEKSDSNSKFLNFICIDKRDAIQNQSPDHRYYDLVKPPK